MNKNFAVVLSGCGVYDGTEIGEAMMMLWAISSTKNQYTFFAPNIPQMHVIDHSKGEVMNESRNVLAEAARIARGKIAPLSTFNAEHFDGIVFPGGFGAAKNLSDLAVKGAEFTVNKEVEAAILAVRALNKPIVALCIAPVVMAKVIKGAEVTIGVDAGTAATVEALGGQHFPIDDATKYHFDAKNNLYTSPCYMLGEETQLADISKACLAIMEAL